MAYAIGSQCTACGVCVTICPNQAVTGEYPQYRIEPLLCTECVLYADYPACVEACPEKAIFEVEEVSFQGAQYER
jgi:ferredoxin